MHPEDSIPLYLFTFNCNKKRPHVNTFISKIIESFPRQVASLYVFGLQELCSILDGSFEKNVHGHLIEYNSLFLEALNMKYGTQDVKFQTVSFSHMGAIGIIAITPYPSKFHKIKTAKSSCGYGYSSMKGAVGIRLTYSPSGKYNPCNQSVELTFANAHLPANEGEYYYLKRNKALEMLMRSLDFSDSYSFLKPGSHTFFMGDLNYRTTNRFNPNSTPTTCLLSLHDQSVAAHNEIERLVKEYDELIYGKRNGDILTGFAEACVNFQPTYKYYVNTAIYNTTRSPSWCDRILYQSTYHNEGTILFRPKKEDEKQKLPNVHCYNSIKSLLQSDHQPVYLSITIPFHPPQPIISSSGYLQVLSGDRSINFDEEISIEGLGGSDINESISGVTEIYMKTTRLDAIIQNFIRPISDFFIGYSLWLSSSSMGRITLLGLALFFWGLYSIVNHI